MNIDKIFREEDLFPREFANFEARDYGILFYDENNKESYDSNHAVIFKDKISDLEAVLADIRSFYQSKGQSPIIYQAAAEEGYFAEHADIFAKHGFKTWEEEIRFMVPVEENHLVTNPEISVKRVTEWDEAFATEIFEKAGEPWEIGVAKKMIQNPNTRFFVAYYQWQPVGMTYVHVRDGVCRYDYILVSKEYRKIGVGRALMNALVEYCKEQSIENCYLWPAGEEAQRIYLEAGFRTVAVKMAGRAALEAVE
ncbi:MAG: GNAT family N-acetyltransferase [Lachnospiraceae bacterium]|nr:GNAT family N-acetyltransferase [Lachnospiraceae bacterium]